MRNTGLATVVRRLFLLLWTCLLPAAVPTGAGAQVPPLPDGAWLAFVEDWSRGEIDPKKWYRLRKRWGEGNHGVVPENVRIEPDLVAGEAKNVLVCEAHGDRYDGPVVGERGRKTRVGSVIVSKPYFASGRFEVVMRIGSTARHDGGPEDPTKPIGTVPAIWTYGYRYARVPRDLAGDFVRDNPLYNPHARQGRGGTSMFWSELDFPEYGKNGDFTRALYNTFCQNRHHPELFDARGAADGEYHTYTTDWRTELHPLPNVTDAQVVEHLGYRWVRDKSVPSTTTSATRSSGSARTGTPSTAARSRRTGSTGTRWPRTPASSRRWPRS